MDISLPDLCNRLPELLRRAEQGERFVIAVDGRPVAELGPHRPRRWVGRARLRGLLGPGAPTLLDDLRGLEGGLADPHRG